MTVHISAKIIINRCQRPGAFLRKAHVSFASGRGQTEFYLEPGSGPVPARIAEEAIRSGRLIARDSDLFGDPDNAQNWHAPATKPKT
jgi:hypothetical protein